MSESPAGGLNNLRTFVPSDFRRLAAGDILLHGRSRLPDSSCTLI